VALPAAIALLSVASQMYGGKRASAVRRAFIAPASEFPNRREKPNENDIPVK
jgi:hypothetical protein